jgi:hypothetical protein
MKECDSPDKCKHLEFVWEGYFCRKYESFIKTSKSTFVKYRLSKCKEWTI